VFLLKSWVQTNRPSSTIGGNKEMDQWYTTTQVSNITRKTKFSHNNWHVFQDSIKSVKTENKEQIWLELLHFILKLSLLSIILSETKTELTLVA